MKKASIVIASLVFVLGSLPAAQQPSPGPAKIAVLIATGQNGHDWKSHVADSGRNGQVICGGWFAG